MFVTHCAHDWSFYVENRCSGSANKFTIKLIKAEMILYIIVGPQTGQRLIDESIVLNCVVRYFCVQLRTECANIPSGFA